MGRKLKKLRFFLLGFFPVYAVLRVEDHVPCACVKKPYMLSGFVFFKYRPRKFFRVVDFSRQVANRFDYDCVKKELTVPADKQIGAVNGTVGY